MLQFILKTPSGGETTVDVAADTFTAGSAPDSPLRIEDPAAAGKHFEVSVRPVGVVLKDLATENGTKVNGSFVSQVRLAAGDVIAVGETEIVFVLQTGEPEPAPAPIGDAPSPAPALSAAPARESYSSKRSPAAAIVPVVTVLLLLGGAVAGGLYLMGMGGGDEETPVAALGPDEARPEAPAEPLPDEPFELPERFRPKKPKPRKPDSGIDLPEEREPEPAPVKVVPKPEKPEKVEVPEERPPVDPGAEAARERERERRVTAGRERLRLLDETLADRIARYTFDGPIGDLESLLGGLPEGAFRDEVAGRLADLEGARRTFQRIRDVLGETGGRKITLSSGLELFVTGVDEEGFTAKAKVGSARLRKRWVELDAETIHDFLADGRPDAEEWLDLSAFASLFGLAEESEIDLFRAYRKDESVKPRIDAALALRRGLAPPEGGFVIYDGEWVTVEEKGYLDRGLEKYEGKWLTHDEVMAAKGYIQYEGRWLSPEDYEEVLEEKRRAEELARKYMPKGLIDKPGNGASEPWTSAGKAPVELKSKNYTIKTNLGKDVANDIAYTMETLNQNFRSIFAMRRGPGKFTVNVCANREEFRSLWRAAGMSLGFCSGSEICTFYQPPMTTGVLMHEGTHQFLRKFAPSCSRWMHEGMATYFECSRFVFDPKKKRVGLEVGLLNSMRLQSFQVQIRSDRAVSLETFLNGKGGDPYAQGWGLVYYLAKGKDGKYAKRLHDFVGETGKGSKVVKEFQKIFRVRDLVSWEKEWKDWILSLNPADGVDLAQDHR